jgi:branched-chain amino acid transport system permease protein
LNVAIGFSGQFQMAQAAFMAISAYTTAVLTLDHQIPFYLAALAAMALVLVFGVIVGLVSLRTRSHYLLLATFGLQIIALQLLTELEVTGGVNGRVATSGVPIGGASLDGTTPEYTMLLIAVAGVGLWVADWLKHSYVGLGLSASRQNERLVLSAGLSPGRLRLGAVLVSAVYAGVAGILFGPVLTYLVPESFGLNMTLLLLLMVVVGGMGSVVGVAAAAVLLTIVSQAAQDSTPSWPLVYGLTIMVILAVAPAGLAGAARALRRRVPALRRGPAA